jgi:hypothetical protein
VEQIDPGCDAPVLAGLLLSAVSPESLARLAREDGPEAGVQRLSDGAIALLRGISRVD